MSCYVAVDRHLSRMSAETEPQLSPCAAAQDIHLCGHHPPQNPNLRSSSEQVADLAALGPFLDVCALQSV